MANRAGQLFALASPAPAGVVVVEATSSSTAMSAVSLHATTGVCGARLKLQLPTYDDGDVQEEDAETDAVPKRRRRTRSKPTSVEERDAATLLCDATTQVLRWLHLAMCES